MCFCKEPAKPMWRHTDECCWSARLDSLFEPRNNPEKSAGGP